MEELHLLSCIALNTLCDWSVYLWGKQSVIAGSFYGVRISNRLLIGLGQERLLPWDLLFRRPRLSQNSVKEFMGTSVTYDSCSSQCQHGRTHYPEHVLVGVTLSILWETLVPFPKYMPATPECCHGFWVVTDTASGYREDFWMCKHLGNRKGKLANLLSPSSQVGLLH